MSGTVLGTVSDFVPGIASGTFLEIVSGTVLGNGSETVTGTVSGSEPGTVTPTQTIGTKCRSRRRERFRRRREGLCILIRICDGIVASLVNDQCYREYVEMNDMGTNSLDPKSISLPSAIIAWFKIDVY